MRKMQEIKELLESGKSVKEVIQSGFKKASVYKVNKDLKDNKVIVKKEVSSEEGTFQESSEPSKTVLEKTQETNPTVESTPPVTSGLDMSDDITQAKEKVTQELFGDDDSKPFRDFDGINISRSNINLDSDGVTFKSETKGTGTGIPLELNQLIAQTYETIAVITEHDYWPLNSKEQKIIKGVCRIPVLEKALKSFGVYGCVLALFTLTLKRIKLEMKDRKQKRIEQPEEFVNVESEMPIDIRSMS